MNCLTFTSSSLRAFCSFLCFPLFAGIFLVVSSCQTFPRTPVSLQLFKKRCNALYIPLRVYIESFISFQFQAFNDLCLEAIRHPLAQIQTIDDPNVPFWRRADDIMTPVLWALLSLSSLINHTLCKGKSCRIIYEEAFFQILDVR